MQYLGGMDMMFVRAETSSMLLHVTGPLLDRVGLNVTVISQYDRIHIGILCDPSLEPVPVALAKGCTDALDALVSAAASHDLAHASAQ